MMDAGYMLTLSDTVRLFYYSNNPHASLEQFILPLLGAGALGTSVLSDAAHARHCLIFLPMQVPMFLPCIYSSR
jgi:hypothetical protein